MCDDWDDLIEYVVQKFLRNFQTGGGCSNESSLPGSCQDQQEGAEAMDQPSGDGNEEGAVGGEDPMSESGASTPDIEVLKGRLKDSG